MVVWAGAVLTGILSGVLVVSGVLKLPDYRRTVVTMRAFHVPRFMQRTWMAVLFALAEIVVGAVPVLFGGARFVVGSWAQTALYALYVGLVISALMRRDEVACNCFGALSSRPVGRGALVRNVTLFAGSLVVSAGVFGTQSLVARLAGFGVGEWIAVVVGVVVVLGAVVLAGALRRATRARVRRGVDFGAGGSEATGQSEVAGRLLVFMTAYCAGCQAIAGDVVRWHETLAPGIDVVVVTLDEAGEFGHVHPELADLAMQGSDAVREAYSVFLVPAAVLLGADDSVEAGPVYGAGPNELVTKLVHDATATR